MIRIHTSDGLTHCVDDIGPELLERLKDPAFQSSIRAITLTEIYDKRARKGESIPVGVTYSLTRPEGFSETSFLIEPIPSRGGGHRVICFAGDTRIALTAHASQPASRVSLVRVGHQRYNPMLE